MRSPLEVIALRYPQPGNEDEFEQKCLLLYRKAWDNERLALYGKRGERQHGVDIHDPFMKEPRQAVQCKFHEVTKTLSPNAIRDEVSKAETFPFRIDHYVIATTAKKSRNAHNAVMALNARPPEQRKFLVELNFWDDICDRLDQLPRIQREMIVYGRKTSAETLNEALCDPEVASLASFVIATLSSRDPVIALDAFGEIERLLKEHRLEIAKYELDKQPHGEQLRRLSAEDRYKLLRLHAIYALETSEYSEASRLFLEAFDCNPHIEQAKQNRVLAYGLAGDHSEAFRLASEYVRSGVTTPAMLSRLIENAPDSQRLGDFFEILQSFLDSDEHINTALFHKFHAFGDRKAETEAVCRALSLAPQSPHVQFAAAMHEHAEARRDEWRNRKAHLIKAKEHYTRSLDASRGVHNRWLEAESLAGRAAIHMQSYDRTAAAADYRASVAAAPKPSAYALKAIGYFLHVQDFDAAWELTDRLDQSKEGRFYSLCVEFLNVSSELERRSLFERMLEVCGEGADDDVAVRLHCVQCGIMLKDYDAAAECITNEFAAAFPFQANVALASIALLARDEKKASEFAAQALREDSRDVHLDDLRVLAQVLRRLRQDEQALDVFERIAIPGSLDDDTWDLIYCAQRLDRHDVLLRVCRELRETGEQDERLRVLEMQLHYQYFPEQGLRLADEFIRTSSSSRYFVAYKNVLAVRLGQRELVQLKKESLPLPEELPVDESTIVTLPFVELRRFDEALRFLYAQLRHNFENADAHGQYITYYFIYADKCSLRNEPVTVTRDCAVLLRTQSGGTRWVVIENRNPVSSRHEFAETSELPSRLIGLSVGDRIELPGVFLDGESATVEVIQTKYVRAFQEAIENYCERFPDAPFLQPIQLDTGNGFDTEPILRTLKQRREHFDTWIAIYQSRPLSLHLLAKQLGLTLLETILLLGSRPDVVVKCSVSSTEEFDRLASSEGNRTKFVLDLSAIATLSLTDSWDCLDASRSYYVSQTTRETIEHWINHAQEFAGRESGRASIMDDGQLLFTETTEEQLDLRLLRLHTIKEAIDARCEIQSAVSVAAVTPKKRERYKEVFGFANVEAMCLANDLDAVLWTDDIVLGLLAKSEIGVEAVWTQLAFNRFAERGILSPDRLELIAAKLVALSYGTLIWNARTIIAAGRAAEWSPQQQPLKKCVALISNSGISLFERTKVAAECIDLLRKSGCPAMRQSPVIQAIFSAVGSRRGVVEIRKRLEGQLLIDPISVDFLRPEFEYWLATHPV